MHKKSVETSITLTWCGSLAEMPAQEPPGNGSQVTTVTNSRPALSSHELEIYCHRRPTVINSGPRPRGVDP
ncbi:hypothetical protein TNCV_1505301 [Trichonephila clavipes]|nr:hypothetical protein TNCV_1505301 [Trichonephila clavipes]